GRDLQDLGEQGTVAAGADRAGLVIAKTEVGADGRPDSGRGFVEQPYVIINAFRVAGEGRLVELDVVASGLYQPFHLAADDIHQPLGDGRTILAHQTSGKRVRTGQRGLDAGARDRLQVQELLDNSQAIGGSQRANNFVLGTL